MGFGMLVRGASVGFIRLDTVWHVSQRLHCRAGEALWGHKQALFWVLEYVPYFIIICGGDLLLKGTPKP